MLLTKSPNVALLDGPAPPRVQVGPSARANSWEDVADLVACLGMPLGDGQEQTFEFAMGERSDGRWASRFVGLSVPRQNGKSQLIVARALAGVLLFGEKLIIISAHETDTAREVWRRLIDVIEANPSVEERVTQRMDAINREFVAFGEGAERQTIQLKARSRSGVRGFSADCLLLDEAQILGKDAWGSIVPTMSARPNPQMWLLGTPPTEGDDPFAFERVRESGLARKARHCWVEWSAESGDDLDSVETWAKANPAFGVRIGREAVEDDRAAMDDDQFARERLGMWAGADARSVIPSGLWLHAGDEFSVAVDRFALGVEVAPDMERASVALAGLRDDGLWHVELDEAREGVDWLVPYVEGLLEANPQVRAVVVDAGGPVASLVEQRGPADWVFRGTRVCVYTPRAAELAAVCANLLAGVVSGDVKHIRQGQLGAAVAGAGKRAYGTDSGLWVWSRMSAAVDITPVQAVTLALIGAQVEQIKKRPVRRRPSGQRRAVVL